MKIKVLTAVITATVLLFAVCSCSMIGNLVEKELGEMGESLSESLAESLSEAGEALASDSYTDSAFEGSTGFEVDVVYDEFTEQDGYSVSGIGSCTDENVVIPKYRKSYFGDVMPYLWDSMNGFRGMQYAKSVTLPEGFLEIRSGFGYSPLLEKVILPSTIRKIGYSGDSRIFENCPEFKEIFFSGTIEQWNAMEKTENWKTSTNAFKVHCADGDVTE